jgi:hypothetical protein
MKNFNLIQEEVDRIKNLHESAPKKLDFSRFEFTINESEEKKSKLQDMLSECGTMMYEIACMEGKECMESYNGMCESVNEMMETYGKKCQETALNEGWMTEEELNENPALMALGRAAAAGAGSAMVNKIMDETEEETSEE